MKPWYRALILLAVLLAALWASTWTQEQFETTIPLWLPCKFNKKQGIVTATQYYSVSGDDQHAPTGKGNQVDLPPIANSRTQFAIDDTEQISQLQQACVPPSFGYSIAVGEQIFPPHTYPSCESKLPPKLPKLYINRENTVFTLECPNDEKGTFLLEPNGLAPNGIYTPRDLEGKWDPRKYKDHEESLGASEFVYAKCDDEYTQMAYQPRPNLTAYNRARQIMETLGVRERPITILLLTVDSFSRRHFYRKLNHTVELLNDLNQDSHFSVFDFKLHNVRAGTSVENMIPLFGNGSYFEVRHPPNRDIVPGALWRILRDLGYVTLVGLETCEYHFQQSLGRRIEVDHLIRNFYCASAKLLHTSSDKSATEQRCIGPHMSHYYMLNYTKAFMQQYKGANQFISIHIDTAHEATGEHAATLDDDLRDFLKSYVSLSEQMNHDLVVFLQADHGMRYGNWFKDIAAYQELKLPALFIITQSKLLDRIPQSREMLWNNTFRLTSKLDLRASILGLAMMPYGQNYPVHGDSYLNSSIDLFREEANSSRVCEDADIEPWYCSCLMFERIDTTACSDDLDSLGRLIQFVAEYSLSVVNRETNTSPLLPEGILCQKLTLGYVRKSYGMRLGKGLELLQVEFSVKESAGVRFEALVVFGSQRDTDQMKQDSERYEILSFVYNGYQVRVRLIGIQRKDKYAGECEVVASSHGVRAEYCVCKDLDNLRTQSPALFNSQRL